MIQEFYEEIRKRNRKKFIAVRAKQLEAEHENQDGVFIPDFLEAETEYNQFKAAGCFDCYGYLKPIGVI